MKIEYEAPEVKVVVLNAQEIICSSEGSRTKPVIVDDDDPFEWE